MRDSLIHPALIYSSDDEFLAVTVPFLREGLTDGEQALAVTSRRNIAALDDALGDDADRDARGRILRGEALGDEGGERVGLDLGRFLRGGSRRDRERGNKCKDSQGVVIRGLAHHYTSRPRASFPFRG